MTTETHLSTKPIHKIFENLNCKVFTDPLHLGLYSTDASIYQIEPLAVAFPSSQKDLEELVQVAYRHNIPIVCRGGGTSLAGQTIGRALVVDLSKNFNKILAYRPEENWIEVQPGLVLDQLNRFLLKDQLIFSPDPSTANRATLGGMIANNSSGTKSIQYGKTIDHILSLKVLLADGNIIEFNATDESEYAQKCKGETRESAIYAKVRELIFANSEEIEKKFPKTLRRVSAYPLDEFVQSKDWNLAKLFCGSEGTLGVILSARLHLDRLPKVKAICLLHFSDRLEAIRAVKGIVEAGPTAVELLDKDILDRAKQNIVTKSYYNDTVVVPADTLLITEYFGDTKEEIDKKILHLKEILSSNSSLLASPVYFEPDKMTSIWELRKKGLGLALSSYDQEKPLPFVEDSAIPLQYLGEYIDQVDAYCKDFGIQMVIYAHASVGVLHVRPYLNLRKQEDIEYLKLISEKCFSLVQKYGGSWSGEHGDGLVRSYKLKEFFGEKLYDCFRQIKNLFDPTNIMNPGKIIDAQPIDVNLRYGTKYEDAPSNHVFHYRKEGSFQNIVHNCSGVGACRKIDGGTMCPSYKATLDESQTTRGRANGLRLAMSGQIYNGDLAHPDILSSLDLCLSCKACKTECPTHVDMAKLKSEVLQTKYKTKGTTLREKMIDRSMDQSRALSGFGAGIVNQFMHSTIGKIIFGRLLGISTKRELPSYSKYKFVDWFRKNYKPPSEPIDRVYLFCDSYINNHDPHIGKAAVRLLISCKYEVELLDIGCCQRPRISNGFLEKAKTQGNLLGQKLAHPLGEHKTILTLEPSCASALQEDLPDLIEDEQLSVKMGNQIKLIDVFLAEELEKGRLKGHFIPVSKEMVIHGHCHQKALYGTSGMHRIYDHTKDLKFSEIDSGCCGMAGSFGYEKEHYDLSEKIAKQVLIPAIDKQSSDVKIIANGFSCRHQIDHFSTKKAIHFVESVTFIAEEG